MLAELREGDTVVVYSLLRLSRGLKHVVDLGEQFERDGVGLISLTKSIETSTAVGRFVHTMLAGLAAMECDLLVERARAGLEVERAAGRKRARIADQPGHAHLLAARGVRAD